MTTIRFKTYDEESIGLEYYNDKDALDLEAMPTHGVVNRLNKALAPELDKLDTVNHEYLITIVIEELP